MRWHRQGIRVAVFGAVTLAAAACGSDGGGNAKQAAIEDLGQVGRILHIGGPLLGGAATPFDVRAILPESCEQGASIVTDGEGRRRFDYYSINPVVSLTRYEFESCRVTASIGATPAQLEYTGEIETGAERDYDPSNLADSYDQYIAFGAGGEALVLGRTIRDVEGTDVVEQAEDRVSGSLEWRHFDNGSDYASVLVRLLERPLPDGYSLVWLQGEANDPLRVKASPGFDLFSVDGPYTYNSSRCPGGARRITTIQEIVRNGRYPVGGEIKIEGSGSVLTITFTQDGATARVDDGAPVKLTAAEVQAALDDPAC